MDEYCDGSGFLFVLFVISLAVFIFSTTSENESQKESPIQSSAIAVFTNVIDNTVQLEKGE